MRTAITISTILGLVLACSGETAPSAAGGGAAHTCFKYLKIDSGTPLCECTTREEARSASDWQKVSSCDEVPNGFCCSDVDTNGEAKDCRCYRARCLRDATG